MIGSVFKRCGCTGPVEVRGGGTVTRRLGQRCPRLRRGDGSWNSRHGSWAIQVQVPGTGSGAKDREHLRRGGLGSEGAAVELLKQVEALLDLAVGADDPLFARRAIASAVRAAWAQGVPLPQEGLIRRQIGLSVPIGVDVLLAEDMREWVAQKRGISRNTRRSYAQQVEDGWIPRLGHLRRDRLTALHVQRAINAMEEEAALIVEQNAQRRAVVEESKAAWREHRSADARAARGLLARMPPFRRARSAVTLRRYRACLSSYLSDRCTSGLLDQNVARFVQLPTAGRVRPRLWTEARIAHWRATGQVPFAVMVWGAQHTVAFLEAARNDEFFAVFVLTAFTGLRRGEACALRMADVDFASGRIEVVQQLLQFGWEAEVDERTKSVDSERAVYAVPLVLKALAGQYRRRKAMRDAAGEGWTETGLVFTTAEGGPIHPAAVTDRLRRIAAQAGLPPIRLHDLRHGVATLGRSVGLGNEVLAAILGHASAAFTGEVYGTVVEELKQDASVRIAAALPFDIDEDLTGLLDPPKARPALRLVR